MPRDSDKHNDSPRGGRDRGGPGKGRSGGGSRGSDRPPGKRGFGGKGDRDKRSFGDKSEGRSFRRREDGGGTRRDYGDRPRFKRDDREGGDKRPFKPRGERRDFDKGDRAPRGDRGDARPAGRFSDRKFGEKRSYGDRDREKRPYTPRGERDGEKRSYAARGERAERKFDDRKFSRGDRDKGSFRDKGEGRPFRRREDGDSPRRDFGDRPRFKRDDREFRGRDRGDEKPWQKRDRKPREDRGGDERPRFSRPRDDREQGDRPFRERPTFSRPRWDKNEGGDRRDGRRRERPEGRADWQEHPRSEGRFSDRPRRDNEDDSKIFAKRPAFGGRGAYRERSYDDKRTRPEPAPKKTGERIAKVLARAGLASRRDAEEMVTQGRVTVNGRVINSPALDVTVNDVVAVDGTPLPPRERTRLFLYHKPRGLMTTHADPEGRPTVFDNLPEGLPRLISIGRLDFNTEGLLLLTNDGGLARTLELPDTGWLRRYRVRAHGEVTQAQLDELKKGVEVDGVKYGPIDATLERDQGANVWVEFAIREGKNREVRNVMAHLGLEVNRLIRISYGPFQLRELEEGKVEEVKTRVLREQLGEKVAKLAGADFARPEQREAGDDDAPRGKKPAAKRAVINDRKGRRVLVQRTGSEEARARNEDEASGYGPPRRPKRGYHGKRDLKPRDE
ncbi:pseudouridine synthase [Bradyrhizobium sp. WSM 1704]|uniref:pseudouridine synthase n=1 Tax=Bradyrhizobium semiaridum TaxID=2821404 RepID=UPI001CE2BF1E|nr:pseudouridine synthase [Bradyrhizobium semiaridum]MCA6122375.1 pseudouridine synthase [Bradyrhizobium semiaridum]